MHSFEQQIPVPTFSSYIPSLGDSRRTESAQSFQNFQFAATHCRTLSLKNFDREIQTNITWLLLESVIKPALRKGERPKVSLHDQHTYSSIPTHIATTKLEQTTMDLARAFTRRNKRTGTSMPSLVRASSTKKRDGPIQRSAISAPLELLSTTNVLAFNAPNIYGSSSSSLSDESDSFMGLSSTRGTTPDNSSIGSASSPVEQNHLSSYFQAPGRSASSAGSHRFSNDTGVPTIPTRALSHTKKSHEAVARQRSISRSIPPPTSIHTPTNPRDTVDMFSTKVDANHPFGPELAQVNELAEEMNIMILDEEEQYLSSRGLLKFGVEEYMDEIQGLFRGSFGNPFNPFGAGWI